MSFFIDYFLQDLFFFNIYFLYLSQENMVLFAADSSSDAWKAYLEYVDDMVVEGFFSAISTSLEYFIENMEGSVRQAPLFESHMLLMGSEIKFKPSLDRDGGDGLYELLEELLGDVFKMSAQMKRVAPHLNLEDYQVLKVRFLNLQWFSKI